MMSKNQLGHHLKESNLLELGTSQWLIHLNNSRLLISLQLDLLLHCILLDIWFQPINHLDINLGSNFLQMEILDMNNLQLLTGLILHHRMEYHHLMEPLHLHTELNLSIKCLLNMVLLHLTIHIQLVLLVKCPLNIHRVVKITLLILNQSNQLQGSHGKHLLLQTNHLRSTPWEVATKT